MDLGCFFTSPFQNVVAGKLFMELKSESVMDVVHFSINKHSDARLTLQLIFIGQCPHLSVVSDYYILRSDFDCVVILVEYTNLFRRVYSLVFALNIKPLFNPPEICVSQLTSNFDSAFTKCDISQI